MSTLSKNHVLFYSEKCHHSKEIIDLISKTSFKNTFIKIKVDYNRNLPKSIKTVPTIIVPTHNEPLAGNSAFMWINTMSNKGQSQQLGQGSNPGQSTHQGQGQGHVTGSQTNNDDDISPFFASEMNSKFSDNFSFIDNTDPLSHQFSFLNPNEGTPTMPNNNTRQESSGDSRQDARVNTMDNDYENLMQQRNNDLSVGHQLERQ